MNLKTHNQIAVLFILATILSAVISGCTPRPVNTPTSALPATAAPTLTVSPPSTSTSVPTETSNTIPLVTLKPGDFYFSLDGNPSIIFSRNIAGYQLTQYYQVLDLMKTGGSKMVRIQLDSLGMGYTNSGAVDEAWATQWEQVFNHAEKDGIYVLPVFSGWFDWNAGSGYSTWAKNPLNAAIGGPIKAPGELFQKGSASQKLWLQWMQTLVKRWQAQKNIAAWEIFSEVNLASGVSESEGIDFVNEAAAAIRSSDPGHRPVSASLAEVGNWPNFYRKTSIDYINIHPYPPSGQLDRNIISGVRQDLATYNKPVLIGESGLSAETPDSNPPTLTTAANASIGIKHAIWAGVVSGALNGRGLYWEDGFAIYFPALNMPFIQKYADADLPAEKFVSGIDFAGFKPLTSQSSGSVFGGVLGNEKMVIGWYRDAGSEPPDWKLQPVITKQTVILTVPGSESQWKVDFYNTKTGTDMISSDMVSRSGGIITVSLPDFSDDIAFKMYIK